jgi:hypothetical protein
MTFILDIVGNNLLKRSTNFQRNLLLIGKQMPIFSTFIHHSLANCMNEI